MGGPEPTVIFLAMHKGGSSFLANDFADALAATFPDLNIMNIGNQIDDETITYDDLKVPATGAALVRVYPAEYDELIEQTPSGTGRLRNTNLVVLQRDPRDAATSRYFSVAFSHSPPSDNGRAENFLERRSDLVEIGPVAGIIRTAQQTLAEFAHLYRILDARPDAHVTSYEAMITDYRGWLHDVGQFLGWALADEEKMFALTRDSFEFPVLGDPTKHVRRITPGNWRRYDRPKLRQTFNQEAAELMQRAGYGWPS